MEAPFKLRKPSFKLGDPGSQIELNCAMKKVGFQAGDRITFCHRDEMIVVEVENSFGAEGLWNQLQPIVDTQVAFEFLLDADAAVGVKNPKATGTVLMPDYIALIDAGIRERHTLTLEFEVIGDITYATA